MIPGLDDWIERQPEPPYIWTCPECGEEVECWSARQMDDMECPACEENAPPEEDENND